MGAGLPRATVSEVYTTASCIKVTVKPSSPLLWSAYIVLIFLILFLADFTEFFFFLALDDIEYILKL